MSMCACVCDWLLSCACQLQHHWFFLKVLVRKIQSKSLKMHTQLLFVSACLIVCVSMCANVLLSPWLRALTAPWVCIASIVNTCGLSLHSSVYFWEMTSQTEALLIGLGLLFSASSSDRLCVTVKHLEVFLRPESLQSGSGLCVKCTRVHEACNTPPTDLVKYISNNNRPRWFSILAFTDATNMCAKQHSLHVSANESVITKRQTACTVKRYDNDWEGDDCETEVYIALSTFLQKVWGCVRDVIAIITELSGKQKQNGLIFAHISDRSRLKAFQIWCVI